MRVAALYDIHGNLPALETVLEDVNRAKVDCVVIGGDIVPGPMPLETLECLLYLKVPVQFIVGNGEVDALAVMAGKNIDRVPEPFREVVRWSTRQLYPIYEKLITTWAKTLFIKIEGLGKVLFCHATPRDDNEIFTKLTPEELLLPIFEHLDVDLVVCGHTHMQFDRMIGKIRVVNAGSVGMPFGEPVANWLLLEKDIQFCKTSYNLTMAAERILNTNYPQVENFVERYILQPPSEDLMLDIFAKANLNKS